MDADHSVNISNFEPFSKWIDRGFDIVIGSISLHGARAEERNGLHRRVLSAVSHRLIERVAVPGIYDTQRGFKLFTAEAAEAVFKKLRIERFGFDIEMLVIARKQGFAIKEVAVEWDNSAGSTVRLRSYIQTARELLRIMQNRLLGRYTPRTIAQALGVRHAYSARKLVNGLEMIVLCAAFVMLIFVFTYSLHLGLVVLVYILCALYLIDLLFNLSIIFRSTTRATEIHVSEEEMQSRVEWPRYSILCPLYKEAVVLPQFVGAMNALDYPKDRLEVLLILEEDDKETIRMAESMHLPNHFKILIVPHSNPKTKPKACNYALDYVTGEYAVIYDAEDIPETTQLKKRYWRLRFVKTKRCAYRQSSTSTIRNRIS